MARVLVAVTGGVAAVKAPHLLRLLRREGHEVRALATPRALEFVTPLSLAVASGGEVATEEAWFRPDGRALHIELARWAEVVLVAPATADALAKFRINPGNVGRGARHDRNFATMIEAAIDHGKPVRVGVNAGSLDPELLDSLMEENARRSDPLSAEDVLREADTATYRAKAVGRACHVLFQPSMHARAVALMQMEAGLRRALAADELAVAFQPIVSIASGRVEGFEALARWPRVGEAPVSPAEFIPVAEDSGLIVPCCTSLGLDGSDLTGCRMSVHARHLNIQQHDVDRRVLQQLERCQPGPRFDCDDAGQQFVHQTAQTRSRQRLIVNDGDLHASWTQLE